jgi:hypothetical protein
MTLGRRQPADRISHVDAHDPLLEVADYVQRHIDQGRAEQEERRSRCHRFA